MKNESKIIGLIFTILFHLFIVFLFSYHPILYIQTSSSSTKSTEVTLKIIDPEKRKVPAVEVQSIPVVQNPNSITPTIAKPVEESKKVKYETDAIICKGKDKNYQGVGFVWQPGNNMITRVPQGLPAYIAGIREGDFFIDADEISPGGYITFNIKRRYEFLVFHIKAEKICYQED